MSKIAFGRILKGSSWILEDLVGYTMIGTTICCSGRIKHLIESKLLQTTSIRLFILDEADKLLDESFEAQVK